jgi:hypothetical protein
MKFHPKFTKFDNFDGGLVFNWNWKSWYLPLELTWQWFCWVVQSDFLQPSITLATNLGWYSYPAFQINMMVGTRPNPAEVTRLSCLITPAPFAWSPRLRSRIFEKWWGTLLSMQASSTRVLFPTFAGPMIGKKHLLFFLFTFLLLLSMLQKLGNGLLTILQN